MKRSLNLVSNVLLVVAVMALFAGIWDDECRWQLIASSAVVAFLSYWTFDASLRI